MLLYNLNSKITDENYQGGIKGIIKDCNRQNLIMEVWGSMIYETF